MLFGHDSAKNLFCLVYVVIPPYKIKGLIWLFLFTIDIRFKAFYMLLL